jgi:hypothetical protein
MLVSIGFFACLVGVAVGYDCVDIDRAGWGARAPTGTSGIGTRVRYIMHHTAGTSCTTQSACINVVKNTQDYHMDSLGKCRSLIEQSPLKACVQAGTILDTIS